MKKNILYRISRSLLSVMCCTLVFIACSDDDTKNRESGPLKFIKVTNTTDFETTLTAGALGNWIVLHGENMNTVKGININGIDCDMREVYVEQAKITLRVPRELPKEATDKITIVTADGATVEMDFPIALPELKVTGIENEFCFVADTMKINGANFDLYNIAKEKDAVAVIGSQEVKLYESFADYVSFIVPAGAEPGDKVYLKYTDNDGVVQQMKVSGAFRDETGMQMDFENYGGWNGGDWITDGSKAGDPLPCNGKFSHLVKNSSDWEWLEWTAVWTIEGAAPKEAWDNPEEWCVRFEILTKKSLTKKAIVFNGDASGYRWEPWQSVEFNTYGKWRTISIDMTDWGGGKTSDEALKGNSNFILQLIPHGVAEDLDIAIDNIRIVKKG